MKAITQRSLRRVHNYLGVFFAPAILFFAFTGALQTIGLHEAHGDAPPPPRWIAAIAGLHKHQVIGGRRGPARPEGGARNGAKPVAAAGPAREHGGPEGGFNPLKLFTMLTSVALFASTTLGLVIALTTRGSRRRSLMLTIAGLALPLALILL